jgi:GNAT superfamily N-acetyltransferase
MQQSLPFRTVLRNGELVLIREVGPDDRPLLREGFARLSDQSRFFRFLGHHKALSEAELDHFTETNSDDHFAIGAISIGVEADMPLATARYVRVAPGAEVAEIAVTIIDSHQRLGLGSLLLRALAREARRRGVRTLSALLHRENSGMEALLKSLGGQRISQGNEVEWQLPLPVKRRRQSGGSADFVLPGLDQSAA